MGFVASLLRNRPFPSHHGRRCWTHRRWARARSTPSLAWLWLDRLFWPWGPLAPLVNGYAHVDGEGHNGIFHTQYHFCFKWTEVSNWESNLQLESNRQFQLSWANKGIRNFSSVK
jgi:hypothetical protein